MMLMLLSSTFHSNFCANFLLLSSFVEESSPIHVAATAFSVRQTVLCRKSQSLTQVGSWIVEPKPRALSANHLSSSIFWLPSWIQKSSPGVVSRSTQINCWHSYLCYFLIFQYISTECGPQSIAFSCLKRLLNELWFMADITSGTNNGMPTQMKHMYH